jgi:ADP-heptose:LPS heptosyltransferase
MGKKKMQIITTNKMVRLAGLKAVLRPGGRYVISDQEATTYLAIENRRRMTGRSDIYTDFTVSAFNSYERRYDGSDANGKNIAVYRHNAFGDSLIATALPRYIRTLYPDAKVYFYCHPDMFDMHLGNQFIEHNMAIPIPIPFEACRFFHHWHVFYEGMLENNSEPDQNNCYDDMFGFCGFRDVPPHFKRPYIFIRPSDYASVRNWETDEKIKLDLGGKYIVYQLMPANENRSYPVLYSRMFWQLFNENFSDYRIYVVGLDEHGRRAGIFRDLPKTVNMLHKAPSFRHLIPLLENAKLVICPDSSIGHLAACFPHVPVISLWGEFHPDDRVKYYGNHYPIFHGKDACRLAPCHCHEFEMNIGKCAQGGRWHEIRDRYNENCKKLGAVHDPNTLDGWCAAMADITPMEILELADKLLKGHRSPEHMSVEEDTSCHSKKIGDGEYEHVDISGELLM